VRVSKDQIINGLLDYIENEVVPAVEDKPMKIIVATAARAIRENHALADSFLDNGTVKMLLGENEDGYEIESLFRALQDSIRQYGPMPIVIPAVPILSPTEKELKFSEADVDEIRRRIERSAG